MPTAAIQMGDGHVVHSCGDCEVEVPMGSRTIDAFPWGAGHGTLRDTRK